jgi:hypothetical protein
MENRISRRRMLRRIGAGAAVAWSAPIISSLRTPAFAQYPPRCTECGGDFCFGQTRCGESGPLGCSCAQPVGQEGGAVCFCYEDDFCANRTRCVRQDQCPSGQTCVHTCCDNITGSVCFSPCGTNPRAAARGSGPTGSSRG